MIDIHPGQFTFSWRHVQINNCSATRYNIIADRCGARCPNTTTHNTITCTGWTITRSPCTFSFALQTVVCEDITGNMSNPLIIILKGIDKHSLVINYTSHSPDRTAGTNVVRYTSLFSYNRITGKYQCTF